MRNFIAIALVATSLGFSPVGFARAATTQSYSPPVMRGGRQKPIAFFGRLKSTGKWCRYDLNTWKGLVQKDVLIGDEFGWAHYDAHRLLSVTYYQQSEDAFAEDQYFIEPDERISKMIRTGAYYGDPIASVIFEPDQQRILRLSAAGKAIVRKMKAAGYDPYFVDWDHFSTLSQIPFQNLLSIAPKSVC